MTGLRKSKSKMDASETPRKHASVGKHASESKTLNRNALSKKKTDLISVFQKKSLKNFVKLGLPDPEKEPWRHISLEPILKAVEKNLGISAPSFAKGDFKKSVLNEPESMQNVCNGIRVGSLNGFELEKGMLEDPEKEDNPFVLLNGLSFLDGSAVEITNAYTEGKELTLRVDIQERFSQPRLLIIVREGACAELRISHAFREGNADLDPDSNQGMINTVMNIYCEDNASLSIIVDKPALIKNLIEKNEQKSRGTKQSLFFNTRVYCGRDSKVSITSFNGEHILSMQDIRVELIEPGAECELAGLSIVRGTNKAFTVTRVNHMAPECKSSQLYKTILYDKGVTEFNGMVYVAPAAQKTESRQVNHNLVLSDRAVAYTQPGLQILADDVQCSHGANVGQLNEEEVFYMKTRGLRDDEAKTALIQGFINEILIKPSS
ncbi:SufD family Fe-S cluster assembly protein [Thermoproteota archaeon]